MFELIMAGDEFTGDRVIPGPTTLKAGNSDLGYYGQVPSDTFITSERLTAAVGFKNGQPLTNNETWLKFSYKGKMLFVAKQPFRNFVSVTDAENLNIVDGGRILRINGYLYAIRLIKGGSTSPGTGSEWNDLIYRVSANDPTGTKWESFSNADLSVGTGNGRSTWCQEKPNGTSRVYRGYASLTDFATGTSATGTVSTGWRPVLELMK